MVPIFEWWRTLWHHAAFWDAFWPAVWGALIGALVAFVLERSYRKGERIRVEVGYCNRLIFILGNMLTTLEDINDSLFEEPKKKFGRAPEWHEIGGMAGVPDRGPDFIIGEFTFLLEDDDPKSKVPAVLGRIYTAEQNFKSILDRLNERTQLWYDYFGKRAAARFRRGEEALHQMTQVSVPAERIKELTAWLAEDIPTAINVFKEIIPILREVLTARYPRRHFIRLWPLKDHAAQPL